jgi:signal recognition particle subunit SRP54
VFESLSDRLGAVLKKLGGRGVLRPEEVEATLREVRIALLEADVNFKVVKEFLERIRTRLAGTELSSRLTPPQQVVQAVHEELVELLGGNDRGIDYAPDPPTVVMLVGLQGSGKTTTAVKLALHGRREGHRPLLVALDLRRPAAVAQLRQLAEREQVDFFSGGGDVSRLAVDALEQARAQKEDLVILDTAGRLHVDAELMDELKRLKKAVPVTQTLLVADAMTGQEAVNVGTAFQSEVGLDGVILTKLDGDVRGGAALSLRVATGQQIRFAGVGERPVDLEVFHADRIASRMLGMGDVLSLIEKAQRDVDQDEAMQLEQQLRGGRISFDDLLLNLRQLKKLGSVQGVLEMLPGMSSMKGQMAGTDPDRDMARMEAIILSMTSQERRRPELIDGSRRRRIARGSGTQVADVNRVIKTREQYEQVAKMLGKQGPRGGMSALGRMLGGR